MNKFDEDFEIIPVSYRERLYVKIGSGMFYLNSHILKNNKCKDIEIEMVVNEIRQGFFDFFKSLFINYREFINYSKRSDPNFEHYFDKTLFINKSNENNRPFLKKFVETQMIQSFFDKKMNPKNSDEILQLLFFDENLDLMKISQQSNKSKLNVC